MRIVLQVSCWIQLQGTCTFPPNRFTHSSQYHLGASLYLNPTDVIIMTFANKYIYIVYAPFYTCKHVYIYSRCICPYNSFSHPTILIFAIDFSSLSCSSALSLSFASVSTGWLHSYLNNVRMRQQRRQHNTTQHNNT